MFVLKIITKSFKYKDKTSKHPNHLSVGRVIREESFLPRVILLLPNAVLRDNLLISTSLTEVGKFGRVCDFLLSSGSATLPSRQSSDLDSSLVLAPIPLSVSVRLFVEADFFTRLSSLTSS